ncbi:MAG TPA: hypothetical protein VK669_03040 [Candidatus Limnocylindrales bacterium]|nr:hypothetical protein [Candidatus Limnocylindrales bacterium]
MFAQIGEDLLCHAHALVRRLAPMTHDEIAAELHPTKFENLLIGHNTVRRIVHAGWSVDDAVPTTLVVAFAWGEPRPPQGLWVLGTFTAFSLSERTQRLERDFREAAQVIKRTPVPE